MRDFAIDLETLGTRYDAPIVSIGCQQFDRDTGKMGATFYRAVGLDSAIRSGRVNGDTLAWWMRQSDKARQVFQDASPYSLPTALDEFATWMRGLTPSPIVWGNGSTFDISILEHAYDVGTAGRKESWHYTNVRDMRTLVEVAQVDPKDFIFKGTAHNALDDATHQAKVICAALAKIKAALKAPAAQAFEEEL